jgi:uncharacterized membrane protein
VTVLVTFLGTLMTVVQRAQITPAYDPVARPGGAGAGPLAGRNDVGATTLANVGFVLIVLGVVLVIVDLFSAAALLIPGLVLIVFGILLWVFSSRSRTPL